MEHSGNVECDHGGFLPPQGHPVRDFLESFGHLECVQESLEMTFEKHPEVWKDFAMRKMAIDTMLRIGTDAIIDKCIKGARWISEVIIHLEKYTSEDTYYDSVLSKATEDVGYLINADERDILHFYKKRIPCSCLDEMYSEIKKSQFRGSKCAHCKQTVKRKDIKTCSRCKFAQYCSKECQISHLPSHKEDCINMAYIHEGLMNYKEER